MYKIAYLNSVHRTTAKFDTIAKTHKNSLKFTWMQWKILEILRSGKIHINLSEIKIVYSTSRNLFVSSL